MILLFSFMYSIGVSTYENIKKNEKLEEFKSRAYESETVTKFGDTYVYHKVARVHEWEIADDRDVFYDPVTRHYPGVEGDILLTFESPFPYTPVIHQMLSFWLGGHAALVGKDNQILQSTGMTANGLLDFSTMVNVVLHRGYDETNEYGVSIQKITNYWMVPYRGVGHAEYPYYGKYYRPEIFAVRTKFRDQNTRQEHIDSAVDFIEDKVDRGLYNYLFIFDTQDKFYCTDLVTRAWAQVNTNSNPNYNLDKDGFIPSDYDILLSDDVYITIYKETITNEDGNQEIHVYYLD
ncbi:MAG TPA: hypothetical protein VK005_01205 [Acholeplasma sp.]|nr:hypothetical protein [Acholeplasma sp.]